MNKIMTRELPDILTGALAADALSMPVHWYYDRAALVRDYGFVDHYMAPKSPHADSILWRSKYEPLNARGDILHGQAEYWGRRGVHYHQFLAAGENTLNLQLSLELIRFIKSHGNYDMELWLERYIEFMLEPGSHRDTYVEECHRGFFTNLARGKKPEDCAVDDVHIGGLAQVPALIAMVGAGHYLIIEIVETHVSLTHKNRDVIRAAGCLARIHRALAAGGDLREVILAEASDYISKKKIAKWEGRPDDEVVGKILSPACYIQDAFPASLYLAWKYAGDFSAGIIANANLGGDNCHRGAVIGAMLAVANGVPPKWREGLLACSDTRLRVS